MNPLLENRQLPEFSAIRPEHVEPAIDALIQEGREQTHELLKTVAQPNWANFVEPLEVLDDRLGRAWSPVSHMNSVVNTDELRDAYNACLPKLSAYGTEMGQNLELFEAYKAVLQNDKSLDAAQQKMLENILRDFHLSGVDLSAQKKARFKEISERLSMLASKFEENVLEATQGWIKAISDIGDLAGMPESAIDLAKQTAEQRESEGWLLTLEFPSYFPVITYADSRELRREMYEAYSTRASETGPNAGKWDNTEVMEELLALRHEAAELLGFSNYAERSLAKKMADSTDEVTGFLHDLAKHSRSQAQKEYDELKRYAQQEFGVETLEPWDIAYYSEKLRQARFDISQEELRPYFPENRVLTGMFDVVSRLFDIDIREKEGVNSWHADVRFFEIFNRDDEMLGQFYLDLYARSKKRGGAWMDGCVTRFRVGQSVQTPVAYLTCNFSPPVGDKPALFTHNEVETMFHEFGHGLHHMLTEIDYPGVAGINGVAWDAVELPSQFLENWCWEKEALAMISGHFETGEPIPHDLYVRMTAAKNFQSGMQMVRQIEFSLFDFRLHLEYDPDKGGRIQQIINEVRDEVSVVRPPEWNRFANGFSHIFAGGYAAGYYSYKWAEVLSADAFSLFEEQGIFDHEAGRSFRENILEKGGSQDAMDLFVAFRGRKPDVEPLLRHTGIAA